MKEFFSRLWNSISIFFMSPILIVFDILDSQFAERKYKKLYELTQKAEEDFRIAQRLFFVDGGYKANKDRISAISKIIKDEAKYTLEALEKLYKEWGEYFDENSRNTMADEIKSLKEILRFGQQNCDP